MRPERAAAKNGWIGFQCFDAVTAVASTSMTDLISILDTVEVPIVVVQHDCKIAGFNKAAADVLSFSPLDIGRASSEIPVLAGLPCLEQECSDVIAGGMESHIDLRDGNRWFVVRISPYVTANRQISGIVLTFTNVTAFRASVDQAVYERECAKAILNTVADPLVVLSSEQRIQSGNRAFYTMFGMSRDETQGVPLCELGSGTFATATLHKQLEEMLAGSHEFLPVEVDNISTAKGYRTLIIHAHPLSFPGHSERRVLVTFQDITTRKLAETAKDLRSEEELRRSETFLAEGQRLSLTGTFSWNVATNKITWSEQLYRIYELEIGVPVTLDLIRTRVHPEDISLIEKMRMVDETRGVINEFEWHWRLMMPDRRIKHLHAIARATCRHDGEVEYIAAVQDVTQQVVSDEALSQARSELARVSRVKLLAVLTASIAHELNQPLSGIVTNASTCMRMLAADPPNVDGARETARRTIRDGNRAADVITRLRALFANKHTANELVDVNDATREVIALSATELQKNRVSLRTELAEDLPLVMGDRVQLQQVILNLIRNGSDAMSAIDDGPRLLLVKSEVDEDERVRVSVRDSGVGFIADNADKLFEAFYTTKDDGMGIGLSVSRSIIESHHGQLWASKNDGPGATFTFSIPCRQEATAAMVGAA